LPFHLPLHIKRKKRTRKEKRLKLFNMWLVSFLFTLVVEVPIFAWIGKKNVPLWRGAIAGAAGTCLTHPLLWFVWPRIMHFSYTGYIVSGELIVAAIESFTFFALARPIPLSRAAAASLIANGTSYGLGVVLQSFGIL